MKESNEKYNEIIRFTQSLIKTNSVNNNEREVAEIIKEKLNEHGIKSKLFGKNKDRKSLVAKIKSDSKKSIILNGHLDTVPVGDIKKWRCDPFSGKLINGKIFGRGACDMKGSLATMTYAFSSLLDEELDGTVILVFNHDEEGGNHSGIREVLKRGIKADACIVGEAIIPSKLPGFKDELIDIGSRGIYRFELVTKGKTAHTGTINEKGINAITKMAELLSTIEKIKLTYSKHNMFPKPKITPSIINGGIAINIVPDRCVAKIDCRLSYGQTRETVLSDIKNLVNNLKKKDKEFSVEINELAYISPYLVNENEEIVRVSTKIVEQVLGYEPKLRVGGAVSDANLIATAGIPNVTLGPTGGNVHSENEFVYSKSLLDFSKIYEMIIRNFLG